MAADARSPKPSPSVGLEPAPLKIIPWTITRVFILIAISLTLTSVAGQVAKFGWGIDYARGLVPGFALDNEGNFPTWYQSASLGICAFLLALVAGETQRRKKQGVWLWRLLALAFLAVSIDEVTSIHEMLSELLRFKLHLTGWLYHGWVIPGAAFVLIMAVAYGRFLMELPPKIRRLFVIAGVLYLGGALGLEVVSGPFVARYGVEHVSWVILTTVEEVLEMAGVIVFLHALLTHLGELRVSLRVSKTL